jgi:CDP-glycerol glycerophosphotransferase
VRRAAREARLRRDRSALVSVVVYAGERDSAWLDPCLESLRGQVHRRVEVIVVVDPANAATAAVARSQSQADWRIRVIEHPGPAGSGRNDGARHARGRYLCFVDPRDVVPPDGLHALAASLEATGSDLAVGRSVRHQSVRSVESPPDPAHDAYLPATTIEQFPLAVADTGTGNRLFRTEFWRGSGLAFPDELDQGGGLLSFEAFIAARRFDVLVDVTYQEMNRNAGVAFGTLSEAMRELPRWLAEQERIRDRLGGVEARPVRDAWAYLVCDSSAVPFVDDAERATDEEWAALRDFLRSVVDEMSAQSWARVRAECKVKTSLVTHDLREELEDFLSRRWWELGNRPTEVIQGQVRALLPFHDEHEVDIPDDCFFMSEEETALNVVLRAVRWLDDGTLELDLFTFIEFDSDLGRRPQMRVEVVDAATGRRSPAQVRQYTDPEVTVVAGHRYQEYAEGACTVQVDVPALVSGSGRWWLEFTLDVHGVVRQGPITRRDERGTAGQIGTAMVGGRRAGDQWVRLEPDAERGLLITAEPAPASLLTSAAVSGRTVNGVIGPSDADLRVLVAARSDGVHARARLVPQPDGSRTFTLTLPKASADQPGGRARTWRLHALDRRRREHSLGFPDRGWWGSGPDSEVLVCGNVEGAAQVVEARRTVVVEALEIGPESARIVGCWPGAAPPSWSVQLRNKRAQLPGTVKDLGDRRFEVTLPLTWDEWGLGTTCLPTGVYFIEVLREVGEDTASVQVLLTPTVADELLKGRLVGNYRVVPVCHGRQLGLRLSAPLGVDERGPFQQQALQNWAKTTDLPIDDHAVYLQSYTGTAATDSQRAIHDELRRQRPELTLYWGVADRSVAVPEGGVPVLLHSAEWYRVLATARYLCNNIDFDRWFTPRPGQQFLQTFHGYPAKSMGIRLWEAKRFTPRRIAQELWRTSEDWDLILTPAPEMDVHYRTEYAYDGPIESAGYPRDDLLVSAEAAAVREATRRRLGIGPTQTVVLYAPTWRDDLATSYRSAPIVRHLDLETASERLGAEYVFLMRGHRFHAKGARRAGRTARLIDVTDYPEINDLILAADAAVLDYSSLRFDFALTGNPMLFLVPDLHQYTGGVRGFLFPFEESAPGPLIEDAEEVVERLLDLEGVRKQYAAAYATFNARFNYLQDGHAAERVVRRFFC